MGIWIIRPHYVISEFAIFDQYVKCLINKLKNMKLKIAPKSLKVQGLITTVLEYAKTSITWVSLDIT